MVLAAFLAVACVVVLYSCYANGLLEKAQWILSLRVGNPTRLETIQEAKRGGEQPSTDGSWASGKYYMLSTELPDELEDADLEIFVGYPETTSVAGTNEVIITITTDDGELYESRYVIESSENLRVIYGPGDPEVVTGGAFERYDGTLEIFFFTIPVDQYGNYNEYLGSRFGEAIVGYNYTKKSTFSGAEGVTQVTFCRL